MKILGYFLVNSPSDFHITNKRIWNWLKWGDEIYSHFWISEGCNKTRECFLLILARRTYVKWTVSDASLIEDSVTREEWISLYE